MKSANIKNLYFKDTSFANLMKHRIYNVLLYASKYDAFILEEDGRIDEQIFYEYTSLNLSSPPRFTLASDEEEANELLSNRVFDLIISMPSGDSINPFNWAKEVKKNHPHIPIVVLTPFSISVSKRIANEDVSAIDYVFSWLGNTDILVAIIKLIEDRMNVLEDVESVGVQVILFVEDSIRFYSSIIPQLYKYVFKQSRSFMTEALNEHEQMLRMRGRPKILLARTYEEAISIYNQYSQNMLGVISDVSFMQQGKKNKKAGINLCKQIRKHDKHLPIIIESTDPKNKYCTDEIGASFLNKFSKTFNLELRKEITDNFGFGDFLFVNPETGKIEARVQYLKALQDSIFTVSDQTLFYHVSRHHISRWLYSRAMFPLAEFLKKISVENDMHDDLQKVRELIFDAIVKYRKIKNQGVVAVFNRDRFDQYSNFARIGDGSMGGKGRGLAFMDAMIKRNDVFSTFENTKIAIPKTVILCTDNFTEFMEMNQLYQVALSEADDEIILQNFLKGRLPQHIIADLMTFVDAVNSPIAVRSSSLLEDSHYQPFAGIYTTYMVPLNKTSKTQMLVMLTESIKAVYASVYYRDSKTYMLATKNVIDEEKMAIVLQETCGNTHGSRYYPSFSGVARSLNFYPIGPEKPEEGVVNIAMGLGKYIVDGGLSLRFSPYYPENVLQTSTLELALKETQNIFYALDLSQKYMVPHIDDGFNLLKINVNDAIEDGTLKYIASTYDIQNEIINDGLYPGRKIISFANILKHKVIPLSEVLKTILKIAQIEMGRPVEIEFAFNIDYSKNKEHTFYLLQIRPIVDSRAILNDNLAEINEDRAIITCKNALGHGVINDIYDIIYVKPEDFNPAKNHDIMLEIDKINRKMLNENRPYILIGPGRWGSNDPWLGIPVKWPNISNARVIVESGLSNYRIDPSQGTHFFQNVTSLGVSYFTINPFQNDGSYDTEFLNLQDAENELKFIRHVHFNKPVIIKVDGRKSLGVILKP